jgi:hypothetical protein
MAIVPVGQLPHSVCVRMTDLQTKLRLLLAAVVVLLGASNTTTA